MLIQLKDFSELMIDLAYSALIYNNTEIAEDVLELEDYIDQLHFQYQNVVLTQECPPDPKFMKARIGLLRIATATEEIADAAEQIARNIIAGITTHPLLQMVIDEAEETITRVRISENSVLIQSPLGKLGLENNIGMWIIAVKRGIDWVYNPSDDFQLKTNDIVITRGYKDGREPLEQLADGTRTEI
jgi:uncharacterized protein with PhoU and TrkA domain